MKPRAFQIHAADNVATLLEDAEPGPLQVLGTATEPVALAAVEKIPRDHKVALRALAEGERVIKYGVPIGVATERIRAGAWVHLHNVASSLDERSSSLDHHTGAPTDTAAAYV